MTAIELLALLIPVLIVGCFLLIGFEAMTAIRRQTEWDEHCDDAQDLTTCTDLDCSMCSDMPVSIDDLFLTELLLPGLLDGSDER